MLSNYQLQHQSRAIGSAFPTIIFVRLSLPAQNGFDAIVDVESEQAMNLDKSGLKVRHHRQRPGHSSWFDGGV